MRAMQTTGQKVVPPLACLVALALWSCQRNAPVHDGFEGPGLSGYWETGKFLPGAVQIQSSVVRAGRGAARITLRPGDQIPQERGSELERAELQESRRLWSAEESTHAYSFSLLIPQDFPISSTRLVIAQWKHRCPINECTPGHPTIAIRYESGELSVTKQIAAEREVLYRTADDIRNRWLDLRFQIRFSRTQNGRIKAWLGNRLIVDHAGVTAYPETGGYTGRGVFYFKVGLYRDHMAKPMNIYLDEYRKQQLTD
jgi:hypothetical protein